MIAVTVLVAVIGFLAALATSQRRQLASLEANFIEQREIELLRLSVERLALADFAAAKPFPRTYLLGNLQAHVSLSKEAERMDLNRVSLEELAENLSEAEVSEEIISHLVRTLEKLREDKKRLSSLSDPVRFGAVDPYRYWITPGLYRFFTVYPSGALRMEIVLKYRGRTYRFLSILAPNHTLLFDYTF